MNKARAVLTSRRRLQIELANGRSGAGFGEPSIKFLELVATQPRQQAIDRRIVAFPVSVFSNPIARGAGNGIS